MIRVKNVNKKYGEFQALEDISFEIKKGEIVGLLGPNGAGKTTTMKIMTCYMAPTSGEVIIDGHDITDESLAIRKKIGYLPESAPLYMDMNVFEYLDYAADMQNVPKKQKMQKMRKAIQECGLEEEMYTTIGELSKGYRQRVGLAQALIHEPEILILDEPTSGLDPNQIIEIRKLIKKIGEKKTVILSTHILSEVEATCNRVLIINKGQIVASGTPNELRNKAAGNIQLHLKVEGSDKQKIVDVLRKLEGIASIYDGNSMEKGITTLLLEIGTNEDMRKIINHHLLNNGLELLEMTKEEQSLENIFRDLTT